MVTDPQRGIVQIDGDLYGLTVPTLNMMDDMTAHCMPLPWFKRCDSVYTYCCQKENLLAKLSYPADWTISTSETGILYSGEPLKDGNYKIAILSAARNRKMFGLVPVLVPLDKNGIPCDIQQYRDGEAVVFAGWMKNGDDRRTKEWENALNYPKNDLYNADRFQFMNTPENPFYQLRWVSWHGWLVGMDVLFDTLPEKAITSGFCGDYIPPEYKQEPVC